MQTKVDESFKNAQPLIRHYLETQTRHIFTVQDLYALFEAERRRWGIVHWAGPGRFVEFLLENEIVRETLLKSETYQPKRRYISGEVTVFEAALSLAKGSYLSHGTAVFLHSLNDQIPKTVYINREQSPKPATVGLLSQQKLDLAFRGRQRTSRYVFNFESHRIVVLSGKNTERFEVIEVYGPSGERLDTTSLERTLVDIAVRPGYAGGIFQVLEAYRGARGRATGDQIHRVLTKMGYTYPYHQAIGFLLERAGYGESDVLPYLGTAMEFDFYLVHGLREKEYNARWRLFHPKGF